MVRLLVTLALALTSVNSWAQSAGDIGPGVEPDLFDPGRRLEEELRRQDREDDINNFKPNRPAISPDENDPASGGPCVQVNEIELKGITILSKYDLRNLKRYRAPACMDRAAISSLMKAIDTTYIERGYITARTYIPNQDLQSSGKLVLQVVEGTVEGVKLNVNEKPAGNIRKTTAFGLQDHEFLNIRDFEQGLEQINRVPSASAKMRLEPGEEPGGSVVVVDVEEKDRLRGYLGWDNQGSSSTGERQLRAQMGFDGLLSANDTINVIYVGSTNANALSGAISFPVGYTTINLSASLSDYLTPLTDVSELFGQTTSYSVSADRVTSRDQNSISHLSGAISYRLNERFINGVGLEPQPTTTASLRFRRIVTKESARWLWEIGARSSLPVFDALEDTVRLSDDQPHAEFQAADFSLTRIGSGKAGHGFWTLSLNGQVASHALLGSQQLSIGSPSTVRGFDDPLAGVDMGLAFQADGTFKMPGTLLGVFGETVPKWYQKARQKVRPYVFADLAGGYSYGLKEYQGALGTGFGLRYQHKKMQLDLGMQMGLVDFGPGRVKPGDTRAMLSARVKTF